MTAVGLRDGCKLVAWRRGAGQPSRTPPRQVASLADRAADWAAEHPEWWAMVLSAGMWAALLADMHMPHGWALCTSRPFEGSLGFTGNLLVAWDSGTLRGLIVAWAMMTIAMMPPLAVPLIRHVAMRSFSSRRDRSVGAFLAGLVGFWLVIGLVWLTVLSGLPRTWMGDGYVAAVGLLIAAAWQLSPMKRAALLRCHRTAALAATGWRADRDCFRYGLSHGRDCVASCWAMMLAMVLAPHGPVIGLCVQCIALRERRSRSPRPGLSALVLAALGLLMMVRSPL